MKNPWMPLYVGDFVADTMHIGPTERGIYISLLLYAWQNDGKIPLDDRKLCNISGCDSRLWWQYKKTVLQFFDVVDGSTAQHRRVISELRRSNEISSKNKAAALQMHSKRRANAERTHTQSQPHTQSELREEERKKDSDKANALSDASASCDPRKELFNEGLAKLAAMTGKGPNACRSFVGKCLKACEDNAVTVLGLIEEAERNRVIDAPAWITAHLRKTGPPFGRPLTPHEQAVKTKQERIDDLRKYANSADDVQPEICRELDSSNLRIVSDNDMPTLQGIYRRSD